MLWAVQEAKSRLVLPHIFALRRRGVPSELFFFPQQASDDEDEESDKAEDEERKEAGALEEEEEHNEVIVFYSYEDYEYAKGVWSWQSEEKPDIRHTTVEDLFRIQKRRHEKKKRNKNKNKNKTTFICIHDHQNEMNIKLKEEISTELSCLHCVPNEEALVEMLTGKWAPSSPLMPLSVEPMASRVVVIRHAQRLDEVNPTWAAQAFRPQDSPLSPQGIEQAQHLGRWLSRQSWAKAGELAGIFSSPFARTVQTAHFSLEEMQKHLPGEAPHAINVEYGLSEGAPWMAHTKESHGLCQTPWHLSAADLFTVSPRIDLSYKSLKHPQFERGPAYPGRPVELERWYDRCAQAVWRMARQPHHVGKTLVLVTHGGCVDNIVHALTGSHLDLPSHTSVTSVVLDQDTGQYAIEKVPASALLETYHHPPQSLDEESLMEIRLSQHHLPPDLRTSTKI